MVISSRPLSLSCQPSPCAAEKQMRQEENSAAVKIACEGEWLMKTKQFRKNEDQNTLSLM